MSDLLRAATANSSARPPQSAAHTKAVPREVAHLWRSNRRLFELLDSANSGAAAAAASGELVGKLLEHAHETLLNLLDDYSSSTSSTTSSSSAPLEIAFRGKSHTLDAHSGAFVQRVSDVLGVDRSVAYGVWHVFLRDEFVAHTVEYDDALLLDVARVYFDERRCLVFVVAALVRAAADELSPLQTVADAAVERLVRDGLPDRIIRQYAALADSKLPASFAGAPLAVQRLAAKQHVLEQVALLELLFLVHYDKVVCPPARFLKLARLFQLHEFGAQQPNAALLDAEGRAAAQRVGATAALVLVETLSLESLLDDDGLERHVVAGSLLAAARGQPDAHQLAAYDAELLAAPLLAPLALVRLAWACVLVRVNNALAAANQPQPYVWHVHAARALGTDGGGGGAFKFALAALCGADELAAPLLETDSPNLLAYNSVLKGLLSATLFAFDVAGLVGQGDLVRLHCALHAGQVEIVRQFWQHDVQYAQLAAVLELTRARFPLEVAPFLSVLASLAADADTATYVCTQYLPAQTTFCAPLLADQREFVSRVAEARLPPTTPSSVSPMRSVHYNSVAGEANAQLQRAQQAAALDRVRFRADSPLALSLAPFDIQLDLEVAAGSDGEASRATRFSVLGGGAAVRWRVDYNGWDVCFALLRATAASAHSVSDAQLESATAVLELLATLIERRPDGRLAAYLLGANPALLQQTTALLWLAAGVIAAQAAAMTGARQRILLAMARAAAAVLLALAATRTAAVWNAWFAHEATRSVETGMLLRAERSADAQIGALRVLITAERSRAHYTFTPVLLDLLLAFLRFAQRWPSQTAAASAMPLHATEQLAPFMSFVRVELFASQSVWRYRSAPQRWLLGAKVLALFDAALADADADADEPLPSADKRAPPELKRRRKQRGDDEQSLADTLTRALLHDATFHTGLLEIVRMGYRPLSRLVAERRAQAAQQLESLIALSLVVLRRVLVAAPRGVTTALHRALLAVHSTVYDAALIIERASAADVDDNDELQGATATSSVIAVLFGYLRPGPLYRRVAVSAAQSLAALMAGDVGTGALPPLLGYLAGSARQCRESFVDTLRTDWPPLQCALLDLCSLALVAQPNVASWLLGEMAPLGGSGAPQVAAGAAAAKSAPPVASQRSHVCAVINSWLERIDAFTSRRPAVLAAAMRLLRVLWTRAPQHSVAAGLLRGNAAFWPSLILIVGKDAVNVERHFPPHNAAIQSTRPELAQPHDDGARALLLSARASVFGVLAWEALYVARDKLDAPLVQALQPLSTRRAMLMWLINYARCSFDADLLASLAAQVRKLGLSVESVRRVRAPEEAPGTPKIVYTFGVADLHDADRSGNPATSFLYDTDRLRRKLAEADVAPDAAAELVLSAARTNACVALCDAQLDLLQTWSAFVRVFRSRHPNTLLAGRGSHDGVLDVCRACAVWLEKETRESSVLDLFASEMTDALLALLTDWLAQAPTPQSLPAAFAPALAALAGTLSRLCRRSSEAPELFRASSTSAPVDTPPIDPLLAGRRTLLAALACATRCVVGAEDAALADAAFRAACVALVAPACDLLARALRNADNFVALNCLHLLSTLCNRAGVALVFIEHARRDLEPHLVALLAQLLEQATLPALAAAVLELLRVLCERDRESAERLFTAGLFKLLAPVRVPRGLADGYEPYKLSVSSGASTADDNVRVVGERNEWHSVWCEALRLVGSLCRVPSLCARDSFGRQLQQFVIVHRVSAAKCIGMSPARFGADATAPPTPAAAAGADASSSSAASAASASSAAAAPLSTSAWLKTMLGGSGTRVAGNKENDEPRNSSRRDPWSVGASSSGRRDEPQLDMATDEAPTGRATPPESSDEVRTFQTTYDRDNESSGEPELTLARLDEAVCWLAVLAHVARHFPQWVNLVGDETRAVPLLMHVLLLVNEFALHLNAPLRLAGLARALSREERHLTTRGAVRDQQQQQQQQQPKGILKVGAGRDGGGGGAGAQQQLTWEEQLATRGSFAHALTGKMRDALLAALGVVRSVGPGIVPDEQRAARGLHAGDQVALSRVLFVAEMEVEHNPANGVSIGALVAAANVALSDLKSGGGGGGASVTLATSALYLALAHLRAHVALADAPRLAVLRDEFGSELSGLIERIQRAFEKLPAVQDDDAEFVKCSLRFVSVILMM